MVTSMLVTDVGDCFRWWQVQDVGDRNNVVTDIIVTTLPSNELGESPNHMSQPSRPLSRMEATKARTTPKTLIHDDHVILRHMLSDSWDDLAL